MTADLPRAERLIAEHTPSPVGDCMCGWSRQHSRRGISHTTHVAQVLAAAQLLACYTPDTASRTIRLSSDRSDSMTTDRTITLTAEQAREVLIGIATLDDTRRAFAVSVIVDALTAADKPVPAAGSALAPMSSVRAELHALAPLPWTADSDGEVRDALSRYQFCVSGQDTNANDARLAELVMRIVNEPEPALIVEMDERTRAVNEVLAAARRLGLAKSTPESAYAVEGILDALDALDGSDGAA